MYLGEAGDNQRLKSDLAIIIEEMLRQRYQGVKNEAGVWITPAFPKLIYVLEEDNVREGTPYFYLTKLAPSVPPSGWFPTTSAKRRCGNTNCPRARPRAMAMCTPAWAAAAS